MLSTPVNPQPELPFQWFRCRPWRQVVLFMVLVFAVVSSVSAYARCLAPLTLEQRARFQKETSTAMNIRILEGAVPAFFASIVLIFLLSRRLRIQSGRHTLEIISLSL